MGTTVENGLIWEYCFDQGNSLHCTLYAISRAVCNSSRRYGKRIKFDELLYKLRQLLILTFEEYADEGWHPEEFNGLLLPEVCYSDVNGQKEDCCSIQLQVTKHPTLDITNIYAYEEEFVLVDRTKSDNGHCMQAICEIENEVDGFKYILCRDSRDSGSRSDRYCHVEKNRPSNDLYMIAIRVTAGMEDDLGLDMGGLSLDGKNNNSKVRTGPSIDEADYPHPSSAWIGSNIGQQFVPSHGRTLQCISYAISECCKELNFYVAPLTVEAYVIKLFLYTKNIDLLEAVIPPEEFNKSIINMDSKDVSQIGCDDIDPHIKVMVLKENPYSYSFSKEYVYSQNGIHEASYYVLCKSVNGANNYFVCRDIAAVLGSKHVRLPWKTADDNYFTLYKVMVKNVVPVDLGIEGMDCD